MKRFFLYAAIFFCTAPLLALSAPDLSLSFESVCSIKMGQLDEYVFLKESVYESDTLSKLVWEMKPELCLGIKMHGAFGGFFAEPSFFAGLPLKTGSMLDSDWQNVSLKNAQDVQYKTNYSQSDNYLAFDTRFGFKTGYSVPVAAYLALSPFAAFSYEHIQFTAKNGTAWYGKRLEGGYWAPYSDEEHRTVQSFKGMNVIAYEREAYYVWLGLDASLALPKGFLLNTGFSLAPYLYAVSYDNHLLRYDTGYDCDFADVTPGCFAAFDWSFSVAYTFCKKHAVCLGAHYFYMRVLRGTDYQKKNTESAYNISTEADGGAGARYLEVTLSYTFSLF